MTTDLTYENNCFTVELNGREVEMAVKAKATYSYSAQTRSDPGYEDFEIYEIIIENAHFTDDNSLVNPESVDPLVEDKLMEMDYSAWESYDAYMEDYYEGKRCDMEEAKRKGEY